MRTFTMGSSDSGASLGRKKDAKSAAHIPASSKSLHICTNLYKERPISKMPQKQVIGLGEMHTSNDRGKIRLVQIRPVSP